MVISWLGKIIPAFTTSYKKSEPACINSGHLVNLLPHLGFKKVITFTYAEHFLSLTHALTAKILSTNRRLGGMDAGKLVPIHVDKIYRLVVSIY